MTRSTLPLALATVALLVAIAVLLWPPQAQDQALVDPWLVRLDLDGDGCISEAEASSMSPHREDFAVLDADGDGCLGEAELETLLLWVDPKWIETPAR